MQVVIQSPGTDGIAKWTMLELQGEVQSKSEEDLGGKMIGDLHFNPQGHPILIIGHHILFGKVSDLDKPLVVMTKKTQSEEHERKLVEYNVTAVITQKLIFKTRPKPIVGEQSRIS